MKRSRIRPVSAKKAKRAASPAGKADAAHLRAVRGLPCCACGKSSPSEAHHCRDLPDYVDIPLYERTPGAGLKSSDRDAIPLCSWCHRMFHLEREQFHTLHFRDYTMIEQTRRAVE